MTLHRSPPGKGAASRRIHFPFITTPRGYEWQAYIAGPCHWFECHDLGRSKPCMHCITNGEVQCDRNHDIDEPVVIGYQPLWQKDTGRPGFVIVYEYAREQIDALKLHKLVSVARGKRKIDVVSIEYASLSAPMYKSTRADFMRPVDLTESLLRIWKMPELVAWYRWKQGGAKDEPPPQPKKVPKLKPLKSDGQPFNAMHEAAASKYGELGPHSVAEDYNSILRAAAKREAEHRKNGHLQNPPE